MQSNIDRSPTVTEECLEEISLQVVDLQLGCWNLDNFDTGGMILDSNELSPTRIVPSVMDISPGLLSFGQSRLSDDFSHDLIIDNGRLNESYDSSLSASFFGD